MRYDIILSLAGILIFLIFGLSAMQVVLSRIHLLFGLLWLRITGKIRIAARGWGFFLGNTRSPKIDFAVFAGSAVYLVKLCGVYRTYTTMLVRNPKSWQFTRPKMFSLLKEQHSHAVVLRFDLKNMLQHVSGFSQMEGLEILPVVLFSPPPKEILVQSETDTQQVLNGDKLYQDLMFTVRGFCRRLQQTEKLSETEAAKQLRADISRALREQ